MTNPRIPHQPTRMLCAVVAGQCPRARAGMMREPIVRKAPRRAERQRPRQQPARQTRRPASADPWRCRRGYRRTCIPMSRNARTFRRKTTDVQTAKECTRTRGDCRSAGCPCYRHGESDNVKYRRQAQLFSKNSTPRRLWRTRSSCCRASRSQKALCASIAMRALFQDHPPAPRR